MRRLLFAVLAWTLVAPAFAQSGPELDALLDAFFAKDLNSLSHHLPPPLEEVVKNLSPDSRQELAPRYLLAQQGREQGGIFTRPDTGAVLAMDRTSRGDNSATEHVEVYLDKYLTGGGESMLRFRMRHPGQERPWDRESPLTVWMRFTEGDWRIYELDVDGREIRLDDPQYLAYLQRPRPSANEESAIGSLRTINTAAVTYSATFPEVGFPESLEVLGIASVPNSSSQSDEDTDSQVERNHAGLIDNTLATPPFEKSGYRFIYRKTAESEYSVVARPLRYGSTGTNSYFTDQSGVVRFTPEDRDATVEDEPLQ